MSISHDKKPPFIASDMFPFAETNNNKKEWESERTSKLGLHIMLHCKKESELHVIILANIK